MIMDWIKTYFSELLMLVAEMAPYLLIGFLFAGILRVAFPRNKVQQYMGRRNFGSVFNAALLGVPMPLCSCGVLPTGISFYRNGASRGATVSFLISTPQTGVDSILATYGMLGLPLAIIRPVVALFTGIAGGLFGNFVDKKIPDTHDSGKQAEEQPERSVRELFRYGFVEMLQDISNWLIIGLMLAAFLSVIIPDDFFTTTVSNEYLSMLLVLAASVPLYVCATGSIPIAAVLLMKGLAPGAALVFLMAGPATNVATMAVIGKSLGRKTLWVYMLSIIGGALFFGILVNEFLPREWITSYLPGHMHEGHVHQTGPFGWLSAILLAGLVINSYIQKYLERKRNIQKTEVMSEEKGMSFVTYSVEGMTCNHCKATVERGIGNLENVTEVLADPGTNELRIKADGLSDEQVRNVIEELGYSFKGRK